VAVKAKEKERGKKGTGQPKIKRNKKGTDLFWRKGRLLLPL